MFGFLIKKGAIKSAQKHIDRLQPKVNILIHEELPLPSVKIVKKLSGKVAEINAFEEKIKRNSIRRYSFTSSSLRIRKQLIVKPCYLSIAALFSSPSQNTR